MPSSTSASDRVLRPPPRGPWGRVWLLALLLAGGATLALELKWRSLGHRPCMASPVALWCYQRERLSGAGAETYALLGASRIQLGIRLEEFAAAMPGYHAVQLAIPGSFPLPVLQDLAADESFCGSVICSAEPGTYQRSLVNQQAFVRLYHQRWGIGSKLSLLLAAPLEQHFVFMQQHLGTEWLLAHAMGRRPPGVNYVSVSFDRSREADYSLINVERLERKRVARLREEIAASPPITAAQWQAVIASLAASAARIEARGGRVWMVSMPTGGRFRELEEQQYPGARFWDPLAEVFGPRAIRAGDLQETVGMCFPDGSHLDHDSAVRFTRLLVHEIQRRTALLSAVGGLSLAPASSR